MFWNILGVIALAIVAVICLAVAALFIFMLIDVFFGIDMTDKTRNWWRNRRKIINPGPSKATREGYMDMAQALMNEPLRISQSRYNMMSHRHVRSHSFDFEGKAPWLSDTYLRTIAEQAEAVRGFDPGRGRTSDEYLRGEGKEWEDYYRGGMRLLADVDDMQARMLDEKRVMEIRRNGVSQLDKQYQASKIELDRLRDKMFAKADDHATFTQAMKEIS